MHPLARSSLRAKYPSLARCARPFASVSASSPHASASSQSTLAAQHAAAVAGKWKGTDTQGGDTKLFAGGEFISSATSRFINVCDPSTQTILTRVPEPTQSELTKTVDAAQSAFEAWRDVSVLARQRIMFEFQSLIRNHMDDIAQVIVLEQGKTFGDAKGDVLRGLQVVEAMCAAPQYLLADKLEVAKDMDTEIRKVPLGVGAAICPFNFPAMIPLWSIVAIATGNSLIIKPSERDPGAAMILAELADKAGLPKGVLSVLHGSVDTVNFLCDEPRVKAISFVGSDKAGKYIYDRAGANGKRVQANLGAKNHCIIMPDANKNFALNSIAGAAFGAAGQRCMALSVLVTVGESQHWVDELVERAKKLKVNNGFAGDAELGPMITPQARDRAERLIASAEEQGGKIILDGRNVQVDGYPSGNWLGPTVIEAKTNMDCYQEEIFAPVLVVVKTNSLDEAIGVINSNRYGNGASIFTQSGATARKFEKLIEAGQLGINVPIPVPLPMFSWSGNKGSVLGQTSLYGKLGVEFWTQNKTTTSLWRAEDALDNRASVSMPTQS